MKCFLYARARTQDPDQARALIDDQVSRMRAYAAERAWRILGVYADEQESAVVMDRPGLQQLLQACRDREDVGTVVVTRVDRLVRRPSDFTNIVSVLDEQGIRLTALDEPTEILDILRAIDPLDSRRNHIADERTS